ncbi:hypothetical protein [Rugosimonospora africana]|uniref:hypothetical protein n=1 Tax=Rugosimonospora africana TaxID=556532 RepID=UPI001941426F|nr:hypothetical protein [Rugosimonospora africana]
MSPDRQPTALVVALVIALLAGRPVRVESPARARMTGPGRLPVSPAQYSAVRRAR